VKTSSMSTNLKNEIENMSYEREDKPKIVTQRSTHMNIVAPALSRKVSVVNISAE